MTATLETPADVVITRFDALVDQTDPSGCHIWTGSRSKDGYGRIRIDGKQIYAHRFALGLAVGRPLAPHEFALHKCDNPPCVNSDHLYVGDQTQNMKDCVDRGRINATGLAAGRLPGGWNAGIYRVGSEQCGTPRGYNRHRRHGEPTCPDCRAAISAYNRARIAERAR